MGRRGRRRDGLLLLVALAIVLLPLLAPWLEDAEFAGADGEAQAVIEGIDPGYRPWAASLWTPAKETEGLLFALQAAAGAGLLGYYFGLRRGERRERRAIADDERD